MPAEAVPALILTIAGISILLMLIRPFRVPEVFWVGGGAALLLLLRLISLPLAGHAIARGSDVYLFLTGMMLLSALARIYGVFDWVAAVAVRAARGSPVRLFALVYAIGTLTTVFLSNDATAVVLTPAILTAVRRARVEPLPHLFACALVANAASFVLPISNPANLVVFHGGMPPLSRWLLSFGLPSVLSIAVTYGVLRLLFRRTLQARMQDVQEPGATLTPDGSLVLAGLALVVAVLLSSSALQQDLGLPTCLAALAVTAAISIRARANPLPLLREISWSTLALVAALFILVDALQSIGALHLTSALLHRVETLGTTRAALVAGFAVGLANNLVNNLPLGLLAGATLQAAHTHGLLGSAILIGVDLGPNLSVTGSLATILWLLALRQEQIHVSFWQFLKVGFIAMPAALLAALAAAIALQHVTGS